MARDAFRSDALVGYRHRRMFGKGASRGPTPPTSAPFIGGLRGKRSPLLPVPRRRAWPSAPTMGAFGSPTTTGIVGHLSYCDNQNVWEERQLPRVRILRRAEPDGRLSMKILWQTRRSGGVLLRLHGDRLDGAGSFSQQLIPAAVNTRQFPPSSTCPRRDAGDRRSWRAPGLAMSPLSSCRVTQASASAPHSAAPVLGDVQSADW